MIFYEETLMKSENDGFSNLLRTEGLQFGIGLFETMRTIDGKIEDFELHLQRMMDSAKELNIHIPAAFHDPERMRKDLEPLASDCLERVGVMKLTLIKDSHSSRWWAQTRSFPYKAKGYLNGFSVSVSKVKKASNSNLIRHKSLNYGENWIEKQKSVENGYQEVLFLNEYNELTEGASSNLFIVKEGIWKTPPLSCGLLPGIMRRRLMDCLSEENISLEEKAFGLDELLKADAVYLTNALVGVMPVVRIEEVRINTLSHSTMMLINKMDPIRSYL